MLNNKVYLAMVVGIATVVILFGMVVITGLLNDRNNELHDKLLTNSITLHQNIFNEIHSLKITIDDLLNKTGNVEDRLNEQNTHYNTTANNTKKLDIIIEGMTNIKTTDGKPILQNVTKKTCGKDGSIIIDGGNIIINSGGGKCKNK